MNMSGGCLCGQVRYITQAQPTTCFVSYRTNCVRQGGAGFLVYVAVPAADLKLQGATRAVFIDESFDGHRVRRHFCTGCGSPMLAEFDTLPGQYCVVAGTLDDPSWVKPRAQIGAAHRLPWAALPTDLPSYEGDVPRP
jgi:hypothetical protein